MTTIGKTSSKDNILCVVNILETITCMTFYTCNLRIVPGNTCRLFNVTKGNILAYLQWDILPDTVFATNQLDKKLILIEHKFISAQLHYINVESGKQIVFQNASERVDLILKVLTHKVNLLDTDVGLRRGQRCLKIYPTLITSGQAYRRSRRLRREIKPDSKKFKQAELLIKGSQRKNGEAREYHFHAYPYRC